MFDHTIRHLLALYPRGATDAQLIWRLAAGGQRISPSELLVGLSSLAERGEIVRDQAGRWCPVRPSAPAGRPLQGGGKVHADPCPVERLHAVAARWSICQDTPSHAPGQEPEPPQSTAKPLPPWPELARYYAATQRRDPRGRIRESADRHAHTWQMLRMQGAWWNDTILHIAMDHLPSTFRESLSRGGYETAAVAWPLSIFSDGSSLEFIPGLILPADLVLAQDQLILTLGRSTPILNPEWLKAVCRRTPWSEDRLRDHLLPEDGARDLGAIHDRLRHALANSGGSGLRISDLDASVDVQGQGLRNAAAMFLPQDNSFTRGCAENLEAMSLWSANDLSPTALAALWSASDANAPIPPPAIFDPRPQEVLTESQRSAAVTALSGPLSLVQGPPGTGKSEVILTLLLCAVLSGRSVLFAARNHQALDEVEERLRRLFGDAPVLTRARDGEGERDVSFLDAFAHIAQAEPGSDPATPSSHKLADLTAEAEALQEILTGAGERQRRAGELSRLAEQLARMDAGTPIAPGGLRHVVRRLKRLIARIRGTAHPPGPDAEAADIQAHIRRCMNDLERLPVLTGAAGDEVFQRRMQLTRQMLEYLPAFAQAMTAPDLDRQASLITRHREMVFQRVKSVRRMTPEDARTVLRHRPIWAVSTLSAPARIPLLPGLFDYVIFDEASQCDIASALPLLGRARRAVVVGDPNQLSFVPPLSLGSEHALMDAAGLPKAGRAQVAQSVNSLFDFCGSRPAAQKLFLKDQFRSAPDIVAYLNDEFYQGQLIVRRDEASFSPPSGYKPGLAWHDVAGHTTRGAEGPYNRAEAQAVVELLLRFAQDVAFDGTVGVISPFNAQISEIRKHCDARLSAQQRTRLSLKISTVDRFQGGEADVVLFSLVLSPTAEPSVKSFLQKEHRRLNVAVSRARALCIMVGDLTHARSCGLRRIAYLAERATASGGKSRPQTFDSAWERRLYDAMRGRGLTPLPQYNVGSRYLDFAIDPDGRKLNIEVDGRRWHTDAAGHRKYADDLRDRELRARGWTVLRFWVHELAYDMEKCLGDIEHTLSQL